MTIPVDLSRPTFEMLKSLAEPFVDTPETVIARLARDELARRKLPEVGQISGTADAALRLDPDRHESLTHSKLIAASVDGKQLHRPRWNGLLDHMHVLALTRLGSFDALQRLSGAHLRPGRYEENGFRYLTDADISIQGVDSNLAWSYSLGIARHLRVPLQVRFEWRHKEDAARPGQVAILEWSPPTIATA